MSAETDIKQQVREFYDQVGWQETVQGQYQNARYEDLRPVSREYIHRCHLRVARHLKSSGKYLLDAGSGPIQYPEYLEYSRGYTARVCLDISIVALKEARNQIGDRQSGGHGLFVVADIAHLPFKPRAFDGEVSLHTIHHLSQEEHVRAYRELYRALAPGGAAVVVNGWDHPPLMELLSAPLRWRKSLALLARRWLGRPVGPQTNQGEKNGRWAVEPKGTYVSKNNAAQLKRTVGESMPLEIWVWRSVSVRFLRAIIRPWLGGRWLLRLLFWLEERFPRFLGENGQYPLIVIKKFG
ncbi:MAG TPA: class I SAM-dependent methyltransferase [Anaerolineales bacterium]|nr:class I SAM-dependent methyltransferase [Anaerolineales bacterium]